MNFQDVSLKNLVIPPLQTKDKRQSCTPLYVDPKTNTQGILSIQTPPVRFPFGHSSMESDGGLRHSISGAFDNYRNDPLMKKFHKFCSDIQDFMIHTAAHNSEAWFGEKATPDMCKMMMNKWVKVAKDKEKAEKYDPTFKITVRAKKDGDGFWATCKDEDGSKIEVDQVAPGSTGCMKIKLTSVYLINSKFGMVWDLEWLKVTKKASGGNIDDYDENMYASEISTIPPMYSAPTTGAETGEEDVAEEDTVGGASKKRERSSEGGDVEDAGGSKKVVEKPKTVTKKPKK